MARAAFQILGALCVAATLVPACKPDFGERESLVDRAEVLAVRIEPPEAKPGEAVTTTLLVASPNGPIDAPAATDKPIELTPDEIAEGWKISAANWALGQHWVHKTLLQSGFAFIGAAPE